MMDLSNIMSGSAERLHKEASENYSDEQLNKEPVPINEPYEHVRVFVWDIETDSVQYTIQNQDIVSITKWSDRSEFIITHQDGSITTVSANLVPILRCKKVEVTPDEK